MYSLKGEPIILASASPRRSEMLVACNIPIEKHVSECDETLVPGEAPKAMVERLSILKAETIAAKFENRWVLGADTTVVIDSDILGKPKDFEDAFDMLSRLQGRTHEVWGAFSIVKRDTGVSRCESFCTKVTLVSLEAAAIRSYIDTKEPMDKAGSYAIQGIGASIVSHVAGSYSNVVGLNLSALIQAMIKLKILASD